MNSAIYWFRNDLRLADLPGLAAAAASGYAVVPCYILDEEADGDWAPGGASRWWLHHSLAALDASLRKLGSALHIRRGKSAHELLALATEVGASAVYCSEACEPRGRLLLRATSDSLWAADIALQVHPGGLLFHPDAIRTGGGQPYRVFTPFWRACMNQPEPAPPLRAPRAAHFAAVQPPGLDIDELALRPVKPDWAAGWQQLWQPGEAGAAAALRRFLKDALDEYPQGRDFPALNATSRLSPHLHFGEISPRQVWHALQGAAGADAAARNKFLAELGWREFSYQLLYHNPEMPVLPLKRNFGSMPWLAQEGHLQAWQRGRTGYPIVDAGMRELWQTGFMHNRVRMITASFLTKHLLLPWQWGERWFWDTLVDADLANNSCGWQWVAGCGADAAPYFRIFNPILQGRKFDPEGHYIRRWVPELAALPTKYLFAPWEAPAAVLASAAVDLGANYPLPIVDHQQARESALQAYAAISNT
ncbi:cryptochrome/photolyase family protein [Haliea sp. E17]|uniref:cryptochrome/photolyase family protein n=1 Tax=Haliea sp. E17 TaxID=3401576 RepID=UPI003AABA93D